MNEKAVTQDVEALAENTQRLLKAVADGDREQCYELIEEGANLNEPGKSVLLRVINYSYFNYAEKTSLVRKLLKAGADVHINHDQPLIDAINGQHYWGIVEALLDAGANITAGALKVAAKSDRLFGWFFYELMDSMTAKES